MARSISGVNKQCSRRHHHHRLEQQHAIDGITFRNYYMNAVPYTRNNGRNFITVDYSTGRFNATTIPMLSDDNNNNNNNISQRTLFSTPKGEMNSATICQLFREIGDRIELTDRGRKPNPSNKSASSFSSSSPSMTTVVQRKSAASLTSEFCESYLSLPDMKRYPSSSRSSSSEKINDAKQEFLKLLLHEEYNVNQESILSAMENHVDVHNSSSPRSLPLRPSDVVRMRELCTPHYEDIFHYILGSASKDLGVAFLVMLRRDVRDVIRYTKFMQQDNKKEKKQDGCEESRSDLLQGEDMTLDSHHRHLTKLQMLERNIQTILTSLFRPGVLNLQRITYQDTPASIIEQIAFREAVHPLQSLDDLRTRLGPGRRCFAFFHPSLPNKPLVFVHVALLHEIPTGMDDLKHASESDETTTCAAFYSITNTERGLAGVDLGNHLIKSVVQVLRNEFPKLNSFCTLSPMPKFRNWLEGKIVRYHEGLVTKKKLQLEEHDNIGDNGDDYTPRFMDDSLFSTMELKQLQKVFSSETYLLDLLETLKFPNWHIKSSETTMSSSSNDSSSSEETNRTGRCPSPLVDELQPLLMKLAAYYLTIETHHGRPLCPVAKFHIRNGAEMYRLNYMADTSRKGMRNSCGMMINYRYSLDEIEENRVRYEIRGEVVVKDGVHCWLESGLDKTSRL